MATVLMTGATGYLGSHLARALINRGFEIVALKRPKSPMNHLEDIKDAIRWHDLDPGELARVTSEVPGFDLILHVATCYGRGGESSQEVHAVNTTLPLQLLSCALERGAPLFINVDTVLERFTGPYALSKAHFREWGQMTAGQGKLGFLNLKLQHFYGPGDDPSKFTTHVIRSCLGNVPRLSLTHGLQQRDFMFIDAAVSACIMALTWAMAQGPGMHEIEVGSGQAVPVRVFVEQVHRLARSSTVLDFGAVPLRENEPMLLQANTDALRGLGWECEISLEDGLQKTLSEEAKNQ